MDGIFHNFLFFCLFYYKKFTSKGRGKGMATLYANNYFIVVIFLSLGVLLPVVALTFGRLLRPSNPTEEKRKTYESGVDPVGSSWVQFNVKYYIFALLFVIFDVETVFLYPWAVAYDSLGLFALVEMLIFITLLIIGLIYAWKKKVLEWN
ncbi:NADH dehydrogenase subunit A [Aneurinibacillus aneurinilyticus ATCC 12856]|uniref:NADH-quinone oxidoreductase subunit A n=2 Tax=Aneurinibacillus aneurinilyticus TaxID=1391 RepID=U1Y8A5_ANEAE|nr:NADH dehydrogenase subunit A [Aneurinibacillus aneurinilyticus ATCC 12856]